jgi:hypothetical protein
VELRLEREILSMRAPFSPLLIALACAACATPAPQRPPAPLLTVEGSATDPARAEIEADVAAARTRIETFFGLPFAAPVGIRLASDRAAFDALLPADWGMANTQCWMVGIGVADWMALLSPAAWPAEACDHDAADARHVQGLITHELVHSFHGQHNPTRDFTGMDEAGWFVEGLAVYVSGQMDSGHMASAADAIANGAAPDALANAWSGKYRYGVSGSLVAYIDDRFGRAQLTGLLDATSTADILARLGLTEAAFLADWKAWVVSRT